MQPVENNGQWRKATIIKKVGERSYLAQTEEGNVYRRNRKFMKATAESDESKSTESSYSNLVADPESPSRSTSKHSQQNLQLNDNSALKSMHGDTVMEPSNSDVNKPCNEQHIQKPELTTTRSGRHVKPPERFSDFVKI